MPIGDSLSIVANGVYGYEEDAGDTRGNSTNVDGEWYGAAGYITYDHSDTASVTFRAEYFKDVGGSRLDFDGITSKKSFTEGSDDAILKSLTVTPQLLIGEHGILRAEFRRDMANHEVFSRQTMVNTPAVQTAQNKNQDTVSLQYIVSF